MSASDLHESMKDPVIRGQYLAAIRNRGKDVLIADVTEAMDLLIEMAVKVQSAERERDEYKHRCKVSDGVCAIAEQQRDHWMQRAKAAERERDELRAGHDTLQRAVDNLDAERDVLRAELARRDAAASEAVGYTNISGLGALSRGFVVSVCPDARQIKPLPLYTAAPPAVLPPEKPVNTDLSRTDIMKNIAYNQALHDVKALGAQPQKPVILPAGREFEMFHTTGCDEPTYVMFMRSDEVLDALDASNVKYEVKK